MMKKKKTGASPSLRSDFPLPAFLRLLSFPLPQFLLHFPLLIAFFHEFRVLAPASIVLDLFFPSYHHQVEIPSTSGRSHPTPIVRPTREACRPPLSKPTPFHSFVHFKNPTNM
ncbi:uncharacterized protein BP01DRAFT_126695 [Aspergillus saccharolyticus JOP 1030-1]|uniref:Uncharacterized protein n=1 Tax=Aspergillus saccharolyticus JOP 1030-1 TaxID=1450539 RepID=A0A319A675_9EURO|nr:hypothetical protein BP01DRAFT_126695 [Aspergillus saccharolyticus JOP 1030-1]PYH42892.1 hypothetical protein BP01DRAFT_126695 [Aspergillus saccharolyticus JOP 1030-1]